MDPGVGSSLDGEYSVTQLPPEDYHYINWLDDRKICETIQGKPTKVLKPLLVPKDTGLIFFTFPVFWGRRSDRLLFLKQSRAP